MRNVGQHGRIQEILIALTVEERTQKLRRKMIDKEEFGKEIHRRFMESELKKRDQFARAVYDAMNEYGLSPWEVAGLFNLIIHNMFDELKEREMNDPN